MEIKKEIWRIDTIACHIKHHIDEVLSIRDLRRHGEGKIVNGRILKGVSTARIVFMSAGRWEFDAGNTNILPVGISQQVFDEHIMHQKTDRLPAHCTATLVDDMLNIPRTPERQRLLNYVLISDTQGQHFEMDLAGLQGTLHFSYSDEEVLELAIRIIDALLDPRGSHVISSPDKTIVANFIKDWLQGKDKELVMPISSFLWKLETSQASDFDFAEIFIKLRRIYGEAEAARIGKLLLDAKYHRQETNYGVSLKKARDPETTGIIDIRRRDMAIRVAFSRVPVDETDYNKAVRKQHKADLVIQTNSEGRVFFFPNAKTPIKWDMINILAMLRWTELKLRNMPFQFSFRDLTSAGMPDGMFCWYYQVEQNAAGGKILNGSKSSPDIEPTVIPFLQIVEMAKTALELGEMYRWEVWKIKNSGSQLSKS